MSSTIRCGAALRLEEMLGLCVTYSSAWLRVGRAYPCPFGQQQETEGVVLSPEDIAAIVAAYEAALERLKVADRNAPMALLVAKTTLEIARDGERDPERLCEGVIQLYRDRWLT